MHYLDFVKKAESHIGHQLKYYWFAEVRYGIIQRVSVDLSKEEIWIWIKDKPFPKKIGLDQAIECECQAPQPPRGA